MGNEAKMSGSFNAIVSSNSSTESLTLLAAAKNPSSPINVSAVNGILNPKRSSRNNSTGPADQEGLDNPPRSRDEEAEDSLLSRSRSVWISSRERSKVNRTTSGLSSGDGRIFKLLGLSGSLPPEKALSKELHLFNTSVSISFGSFITVRS
ncbi:LOW QUALITY PROTEIN: hypothetical protein HID58_061887 [Brassica napus]|uniref:Uncharacterized protein n=1 Tax=Brassica napus TaxID=3708 RepID=A0ABQ7ZZW2_BRANA|nr:LOW QUALITY PROTEIN: hypothetical protein HID58_061887 [Brassica napus]